MPEDRIYYSVSGLPALAILLAIALLWVIPLFNLLPKFGMSKWLSLLGLIPVIGLVVTFVFMWIMAFSNQTPGEASI